MSDQTPQPGWDTGAPKRSNFNGKALLIIGALVLVAYLVFNRQTPTQSPVINDGGDGGNGGYQEQYGGSASVYAQIAANTDCDSLQQTFDRAAANNDGAEPGSDEAKWTTGYMSAADDRMQELGCY